MKGKNTVLLEFETLTHASEFCRILDKSNDYFLLSRFASSSARRKYFLDKYEEIKPKADLILKELWNLEVFKQIKEIVCKD